MCILDICKICNYLYAMFYMYIDNVSFLEHYKLTCSYTLAIWLHTIMYIISKNDQWNFTFKLIFTNTNHLVLFAVCSMKPVSLWMLYCLLIIMNYNVLYSEIFDQSLGPVCCTFYIFVFMWLLYYLQVTEWSSLSLPPPRGSLSCTELQRNAPPTQTDST